MRELEWHDEFCDGEWHFDEHSNGNDCVYSTNDGSGYLIEPHSINESDPLHPVIKYRAIGDGPGGAQSERLLGIFHSIQAAKSFCETHYWLTWIAENPAVSPPE